MSRRTRNVWGVFLASMTVVLGALTLGDPGAGAGSLIATQVSVIGDTRPGRDQLFDTQAPIDEDRWQEIVIHGLGRPSGNAETVHRLHQSYGYEGLGYHFLIGNGAGLGDGTIQVGYRWDRQQPGAHVARVALDHRRHNQHSIGICLVGNGDVRAFSDGQMRTLVSLVRSLQRRFEIPAGRVVLHSDLAPGVPSPGTHFAEAWMRQQLEP
jgi:hypothetical protein